ISVTLSVMAYQNFWFWRLWWFDNVLHFISAISAGLVFLLVYFIVARQDGQPISPTWTEVLLAATSSIFALGFIWELFEFSIDKYWAASVAVKQLAMIEIGFGDSIWDLISDIFGALVASRIFKSTYTETNYDKI
ncbi:MAG: hypothetical protein AAB821_03045, partial [Patescibacteria group bacterium]